MTGAEEEASEADKDRVDAAAAGQEQQRGVELGFCPRCDTDGHAFRYLTVKDEHTR